VNTFYFSPVTVDVWECTRNLIRRAAARCYHSSLDNKDHGP